MINSILRHGPINEEGGNKECLKIKKAVERGIHIIKDLQGFENSVKSSELRPISVDEGLKTVFENLFQNAEKHSRTEKVDVKISDGEECVIKVIDYGKGIPDDLKEKVFEKGFKFESNRTGLGLFIVRKIVEKYGGRVKVEDSKPSTFVITIPKHFC